MNNQPRVEFAGLPADAHRCTGEIVGDWVVFKCPICEGYERRINLVAGQMKAKGQNDFLHFGSPNNHANALALLQLASKN